MGRAGRPRTVQAPPCPGCESEERVVPKGLKDVEGEPRRAFLCQACDGVFVPGVNVQPPSPELKAAVRRVRAETQVPLRLLASAMANNLGVDVSHATIGAWCREKQEPGGAESASEEAMACEYISILWALRHEIDAEKRPSS